jgi:hypothetical protein
MKPFRCRARTAIALIAISLLYADCYGFQAADENAPDGQPSKHKLEQYVGPRMRYWLARPISKQDLDWMTQRLHLAEPQQLFLRQEIYSEYAEAAGKLHAQYAHRIDKLSIEAAQEALPTYTERYLPIMAEFLSAQNDYYRKLTSLDASLFDLLSVVLSEQQLIELEFLKIHRKGERCDLDACWIPIAQIHLRAYFEKMFAQADLQDMVSGILREYEIAAVPIQLELQQAMFDNSFAFHELIVALTRLTSQRPTGFEARFEDLLEKRSKLLARTGRLQGRLADINKQYLSRICESLPQAEGEYFGRSVKYLAYRELVWPDALDPASTFDAVHEAVKDVADLRNALWAYFDQYKTTYQSISREMEDRYDKWRENYAAVMVNYGYADYQKAMRALREKRWLLDRKLIDQCTSIMPVETLPSVKPVVDDYLKRFQTTMHEAKRDSYPGI